MSREIPEHLRPLVDRAISAARELIEKGGELPGVAFIDTNMDTDPGKPGFVVIPMSMVGAALPVGMTGGDVKDAWAKMVQFAARATEARFVMVVSEVWYVDDPAHAANHDAILKQYGSLQNAPMSIEGITFVVETHAGNWMGLAPLTKTGGKKSFGEVKLGLANATGRLFGLLGAPKGSKH
jgi:hypothetical protein